MNKIYRLKFDRRRNQLVAVSELTTGAGKQKSTVRAASPAGIEGTGAGTLRPLLATLALAVLPGLALANPDLPVGGQIVAGQGGISTSGNQMTIQQQTQKLVTQWQSFDVGAQNTVRFIQPDSNSVALNRVMGAGGSQILGSLQANGQVIILNPNGVLFGKDAQVNVAGLLASTKNLGNADFMAGRYDLSGGGADAQVINQGSLAAAPGGYIVLAGDQVKNSGTIAAPAGKAVLAAADKVSLQLDNAGLVSVSVSGSVVNALVENTGLVAATNGQVYLTARGRDMLLNTVVNNSGTVEATGLNSHGGEIVLDGGDSGVTSQSGRLLADSATGQGGKITVEGRNIHLAATGKASATGKTGGGQVYVGGGWQGKDGKIRNASKVVMDKAATIDVSATQGGNGGTAVLWSDDYTNFQGTILARGGAGAGNGGQVETSSHGNLQAFGDVDASATAGQGGNWLLDPLDVAIVKGEVNTDVSLKPDAAASGQVFSPSANGAQVSATKIAEQLNSGTNVTVETRGVGAQLGTITFKSDAQIKKTTAGEATLTLKADKDIVFEKRPWVDASSPDATAIGTAGKLNLNLLTGNSGQDGNINIGAFVHFNLNGGDFQAGPASAAGGQTSMTFVNNGSVTASNITLDTQGGVSGLFYSLTAGGNLTVKGPVAHGSGYGLPSLFKAGNLLDITAASGDIKFSADVVKGEGAAGSLVIDGRKGVNIQANNGHLVMNVLDRKQNAITVSSSEGAVNLGGKVQDGSNAFELNSVDISSAGNTKLDGLTGWGKATLLSDVTLNATGNIDIAGAARFVGTDKLGAAASNGVTLTSSRLTAGGNVTMTGLSGSDPANLRADNALTIWRSTLEAGASTGKIQLNGTTKSIVGVKMTGSTLSAASLEVNGVATDKGMGFWLENNQLQGGLTDPKNVVLSSAGSFAGVTNLPVVSEPPPKPVEPPSGTGDPGKVPDSDADKGAGDTDKNPDVGGGQGAGDADKGPSSDADKDAGDADKKPDVGGGQGTGGADKDPDASGSQGAGDADKDPDSEGDKGAGDVDKNPDAGGGQGAGDADKGPSSDADKDAGDADKKP
ncbi:filamentous hemagglutinin N-terminal domain-containing protein, partial [Achromobacter xylosoxidans]|uniref:two-partner secretion domain-containing protein n=1 Tax=Alcaligenes xylosoxydans xylosoxydans TaxID=85698 RepID=UPI0022B8D299